MKNFLSCLCEKIKLRMPPFAEGTTSKPPDCATESNFAPSSSLKIIIDVARKIQLFQILNIGRYFGIVAVEIIALVTGWLTEGFGEKCGT